MAYVITAVGAGGKTTYLNMRAQEFLRQGKRVAITTTTHIWPCGVKKALSCQLLPAVKDGGTQMYEAGNAGGTQMYEAGNASGTQIYEADNAGVHIAGILERSGKLAAPDEETFGRICREYDVVLVEGDGSHCMPMKIPAAHEPVIPFNTDEIAVVMGAHAIGRRIDVVCQRYEENRIGSKQSYEGGRSVGSVNNCGISGISGISGIRKSAGGTNNSGSGNCVELVTEAMLETMAQQEYIIPLQKKYPDAYIHFHISRMPKTDLRIKAVLMASGFGRRYGKNKLLDMLRGKPLYRHALDHITAALGMENVVVVTQYGEIMDQAKELGIAAVHNPQALEGIAASIRLGTQWALDAGADAVMFFAADMPDLPANEIGLFAEQFAGSGKPYGCMEFGRAHICTNPGALRLDTGAKKLLQLTGDRGAMRIMKQEPWNIYYYQIPPEYAADVDVPSLAEE